ncbi:MAG TPA: EamA family transporter [Ideonella sp.]|uniref:EamA family transporter n=1 Tax=Ideonella sp. TaxID=1929293 RepID=UPI002E3042A8|nr:EamA family transporter [Ideonella sp.]HEX5687972.1 EamA family transporter [Ideonella sp.]
MSWFALALVLVAALLHAAWNVAAKKAGGNHHFVLMGALLIVVLWAPVGLWAAWDVVPRWGPLEWALIVASGITHLVYFNVLLKGYRESDLTVVYPVARGTGPLLSSVGAMLLLSEWPSIVGVVGLAGIVTGIWLIAGGPALWHKAHEVHDPVQRARVRAGLGWGALTGVLIASYTLIDGYAVKVVLISPILVDYFGNLARIPFMLPSMLKDKAGFRAAWRSQWQYALVMATISPLAYVLVLYAAQQAPLSHVAPAREVSMLFAALIGGRLLGEADRGWRLAGAALMAAGVIALAMG